MFYIVYNDNTEMTIVHGKNSFYVIDFFIEESYNWFSSETRQKNLFVRTEKFQCKISIILSYLNRVVIQPNVVSFLVIESSFRSYSVI